MTTERPPPLAAGMLKFSAPAGVGMASPRASIAMYAAPAPPMAPTRSSNSRRVTVISSTSPRASSFEVGHGRRDDDLFGNIVGALGIGARNRPGRCELAELLLHHRRLADDVGEAGVHQQVFHRFKSLLSGSRARLEGLGKGGDAPGNRLALQ